MFLYTYVNICTCKKGGLTMLELGIAQAQTQFTKLLSQTVVIVDKKARLKKAVILPYDEYKKLLSNAISNDNTEHGEFNQFVGILDDEFATDDEKYNRVAQ